MAESEWATEAELCADFIASVPKDWTSYPETADWDILLVRDEDGFQIGVEAKMRLNAKVLRQAVEDSWSWDRGPDCRAVLVPERRGDFGILADALGITVIEMRPKRMRRLNGTFQPHLPKPNARFGFEDRDWYERCPLQRHNLPDYVPDVAAGVSGPVKLTAWKIKALKIAVLLETRGVVTRADFKALNIDIRRWLHPSGWLLPKGDGFTAGPHIPDFRAQHPQVYGQIAADIDDWLPKVETSKGLLL